MKTPEEIKRGLECCAIRKSCAECPYRDDTLSEGCMNAMEANALAHIKQLEMLAKPNEQTRWERDVAVDQLRQLGIGFGEKIEAQVPKWISVADGLPEEPGEVLMVLYGRVCIAWYHCDGRFESGSGYVWTAGMGEVTHWMPLPEAPKEG